MASKSRPDIIAAASVILVVIIAVLLFPYSGIGNKNAIQQKSGALNFSTVVNRSNALFGIPNQSSFALSYNFNESPAPHHNNYTTIGTLFFESKAYGLNSTGIILNYSSQISPFEYTVHVNSSKGDYPVSVIIYAWESNTQSNATARYLGLLHNSMGEAYKY